MLHLFSPLTHRLPMHPQPARHFRLVNPLAQQIGCPQTPLFQLPEIPSHSRWISHAETIAQALKNVTILCNS